MALEDLTPDEQLTYWVGAVARSAVQLEIRVQWLFRRLIGSTSPAWVLLSPEVGRALRQCRDVLGTLRGAPPWLVDEGTAALNSASEALVERNRFVHDALAPIPGEEGVWTRRKASLPSRQASRVTLDTLRQAHEDLVRAGWRVSGVAHAVDRFLRPVPDDHTDYAGSDEYLDRMTMRGEFTIESDTAIVYDIASD